MNVKKIFAVIYATYAVAKRKTSFLYVLMANLFLNELPNICAKKRKSPEP